MTEVQAIQDRAQDESVQSAWAIRTSTALKYVLLFMAALAVILYVVIACIRMPYPYELEWMEGGMVDHMRWILAGHPLYVQPSLEFIPNIYGPLYPYLGAALCKVMGVGFLAPRLISFVSSLGCFGLIALFVWKETRSSLWALVSVGVFAASYRATGAWMDIARVDSLQLLLVLGAVCLLRFRNDTPSIFSAGLLMGLAFLAKQTALFIALPLILYTLWVYRGRSRYVFVATFVAFVVLTTIAFDVATHGWYTYYLFDLPAEHRFIRIMWFGFWWNDIGKNIAVALAVTVFALALRSRQPGIGLYVAAMLGMVGSSWLSRLHVGGYDNVLLPAFAILAIGFGLGASALQSALTGVPDTAGHFAAGRALRARRWQPSTCWASGN